MQIAAEYQYTVFPEMSNEYGRKMPEMKKTMGVEMMVEIRSCNLRQVSTSASFLTGKKWVAKKLVRKQARRPPTDTNIGKLIEVK
mmetsp:Transcript_4653/g.7164  ORF Transcript_4653/g.7164 Transcript_4653/m.7164 type:complete len:85 (-) Transcript_4653:983-1237(-)